MISILKMERSSSKILSFHVIFSLVPFFPIFIRFGNDFFGFIMTRLRQNCMVSNINEIVQLWLSGNRNKYPNNPHTDWTFRITCNSWMRHSILLFKHPHQTASTQSTSSPDVNVGWVYDDVDWTKWIWEKTNNEMTFRTKLNRKQLKRFNCAYIKNCGWQLNIFVLEIIETCRWFASSSNIQPYNFRFRTLQINQYQFVRLLSS